MMKPAYIRANSVTHALEILGDRWVLMLLQQAFFGVRRFDDFQRRLGLARSTLTHRLKHLVAHGILERQALDARDWRFEYRLTVKGRDLFNVALMCERWQRDWAAGERQPVLRLLHRDCGHVMEPVLVCATCSDPVHARDVSYCDGPGASWTVREPRRRRRRSSIDGPAPRTVQVSSELLELLGDRWTPQVAAVAFFGVRRFDDMRASLQLATNILSDRLKRLIELGIFATRTYQERPRRLEYVLTGKGLALYPIMLTLMDWGDRWVANEAGPPLLLTHRPCGSRLVTSVVCDHCGGPLLRDNVSPQFGPPPRSTERRFA